MHALRVLVWLAHVPITRGDWDPAVPPPRLSHRNFAAATGTKGSAHKCMCLPAVAWGSHHRRRIPVTGLTLAGSMPAGWFNACSDGGRDPQPE